MPAALLVALALGACGGGGGKNPEEVPREGGEPNVGLVKETCDREVQSNPVGESRSESVEGQAEGTEQARVDTCVQRASECVQSEGSAQGDGSDKGTDPGGSNAGGNARLEACVEQAVRADGDDTADPEGGGGTQGLDADGQ